MSTETDTIVEAATHSMSDVRKYAKKNALEIGAQITRGFMAVCDTGTGA
jgi:hypothetical protein